MRVRVELPEQSDVDEHAAANARDEIPDRTPYGLHHLADDPDVELDLRRPLRSTRASWVARKVRNRLNGFEAVSAAVGVASPARRAADVVYCMDERTGFPAALAPGGPPVVANLVWIGRPEDYSPARRRLVARALDRLAGVVSMTDALRFDLIDGWGLDPAKVHRIRLGIDTEFFAPRPWAETADAGVPTVGSVGDDPFRDHPLLVEAMRRLRGRGVDLRLELGTTMAHVEVPAELGVVHRRRMEGAVRAMYGRSSVVAVALTVGTTRGSGSTVVMEAAASGRPIVATRTPAMAQIVEDGVRGLLVEPGDPDAFADAVGSLLADPDRARTMGETARAWVRDQHTSARMMAELREVLRTTLARS